MFILLSHRINIHTPVYGGQKGLSVHYVNSIENGDSANTSRWEFPNHIGTHIDFPFHFYQNGQTIEDFSPDFWYYQKNKIQLIEVDLSKDLLIKPKYIINDDIQFDAELLLIKTGYSKYRSNRKYWEFNPGLSEEFSDWIRRMFNNLRLIGIDSISISSWQYRDIGRKVHQKLLDPTNPILIIEDMDLSKVSKSTHFKNICVLPLMVEESDGSPCTILAEIQYDHE